MKIVRGKVAIALVGIIFLVPLAWIMVGRLHEIAIIECSATPTMQPDFAVTVDFNLGSFDWICHKRWPDTGVREDKHLPFFPWT